jgi:membrane protease YdiL (CAAX protease family)
MTPYAVDTMSRHELRKCYNRYCWSVMLLFPLGSLVAAGLLRSSYIVLPGLYSDPFWSELLLGGINAVASYLPATLIFLILLRRFPRADKLPVDRLGLWELLQAAVFTLGTTFLFNILTLNLVSLLEGMTGADTVDRIAANDATTPVWSMVIFSVLIPPVCEELLFRKLLLNRLRSLGDVSAVYLSALAFSLFHANFYQMIYAFALGIFFAVVVLLTGSIRDTILLHMLVNGMTTLGYAMEGEVFFTVRWLVYLLCALLAIALYFSKRSHFHLEPGPLHLSARDKRRACLGSPWFYVMLLVCVTGSIAIIFR